MIPSIILRKIISQIYTLDLETYAWNKDYQKKLFSIKVKDMGKSFTLKDIYTNGCNIGNCFSFS